MTIHNELTKEHLDALQEISNIGIGNAASALADLLKDKVDISIPRCGIVSFQNVLELIGGVEESVIGVQLSIDGDAPCIMLFLFDEKSAMTLSNKLITISLGLERDNTDFDDLAQSAIQEIGNILTATFANAISQMTSLTLITSPPALAYDMLGAIVSESLVLSGQIDDNVFIFDTQFFQEDEAITGHFLLLPTPGTLEKILSRLGFNIH